MILQALWLILPAYVANSSATLAHGKTPLDMDRKFLDGRPILGHGKTVEGSVAGVVFGTAAGAVQSVFSTGGFEMSVTLAFLLATGAVMGDICGAFIKRRLGIKRGDPFPIVDQLDFVAGALLLSSLYKPVALDTALVLAIITPLVHLVANLISFRLGYKSVPW